MAKKPNLLIFLMLLILFLWYNLSIKKSVHLSLNEDSSHLEWLSEVSNKHPINISRICYFQVTRDRHTGRKLHLCEICQKHFSRKNHLVDHLRTHTGEKPYVCQICKKGFTQKSNLKKHIGSCISTGKNIM